MSSLTEANVSHSIQFQYVRPTERCVNLRPSQQTRKSLAISWLKSQGAPERLSSKAMASYDSVMMMRCLLVAFLFSTSGCLYFDADDDSSWGGDGWTEPAPVPDGGGYDQCYSDWDCTEGCYCEDGQCVVSDFCYSDYDCDYLGEGWTCDTARDTCIPTSPPPADTCNTDADCTAGCYCDDSGIIGYCTPSDFCQTNDDCTNSLGDGWTCDTTRDTCIPDNTPPPQTCTLSADCDSDCCDVVSGVCIAGPTPIASCRIDPTACSANADCSVDECCSQSSQTCQDTTAPVVVDCMIDPPTCDAYDADETGCIADPLCAPAYTGLNCQDPTGQPCTGGMANCTCDVWIFADCQGI